MAKWADLLKQVIDVGLKALTEERRQTGARPARSAQPQARQNRTPAPAPPRQGRVRTAPSAERARTIVYAPELDGAADPGEIVWTWVPFEDDPRQGKDRPLLVVGRNGAELLGLMLSSQDKRSGDPDWLALGAGAWDGEGRGSYIRLDRVIEVGEHDIRREGAVLDRQRFDLVADELRTRFGWR